jgi:hypothetical protein
MMFVVVEEAYGTVYVTGPFDTKEEAKAQVLKELRSIVSDWRDDFYSTLDDEDLMMEWETSPFTLFEDTDYDIRVTELLPPS